MLRAAIFVIYEETHPFTVTTILLHDRNIDKVTWLCFLLLKCFL